MRIVSTIYTYHSAEGGRIAGNPATEAQASDRAQRIGQDKPLFVYTLIVRGSPEEKIQQLQHSKARLANGLLDSSELGQLQLGEDELRALFAPLDGNTVGLVLRLAGRNDGVG